MNFTNLLKMKILITDAELQAYAEGTLRSEDKKELEQRALLTGQSDLLLHATLAWNACIDSDLDDILGQQPTNAPFVKVEIPKKERTVSRKRRTIVAIHRRVLPCRAVASISTEMKVKK